MQDVQGYNSNYSVHFFHTSEMEAIFKNLFRTVFMGAHGLFNFLILLSLDITETIIILLSSYFWNLRQVNNYSSAKGDFE